MASKPWAGEIWFGGVLVLGGLAIASISFMDDSRASVRTAVIGVLIFSGGVRTMIRARREVRPTRSRTQERSRVDVLAPGERDRGVRDVRGKRRNRDEAQRGGERI